MIGIIYIFLFLVVLFFILIIYLFFKLLNFLTLNRNKVFDFVDEDVPYYREIPCEKNIFYAYLVAVNYNLINKKEDFLGAIFLKWIKDGNVKIEKYNNFTNIIFVKRPNDTIELEDNLYDYMIMSSYDGVLEVGEFSRWCSKNRSKILGWFNDILYFETIRLMKKGKVILKNGSSMKFFNYKHFYMDSSLKDEAIKLAGLKKFLQNFSIINQREPIEVNLWNEYLMYAQMFGIANEVTNQLKELYPDVINYFDGIDFSLNNNEFFEKINYFKLEGVNLSSTAMSINKKIKKVGDDYE